MTQYGLISDVHGNLPALQTVLDDMPPVDGILCCGDVLGVLGWPSACLNVVMDECDHVVVGNHDVPVREDYIYVPEYLPHRLEMEMVTEQLSASQVETVNNLPERVETDEWMMAHSWPVQLFDHPSTFVGFTDRDSGVTSANATRLGPHLNGKMAFVGHTHEQFFQDMDKFPGQSGAIVNPGSVGVPWYSDAEYAVVDTEEQSAELHSVEYDSDPVLEECEEWDVTPDIWDAERP